MLRVKTEVQCQDCGEIAPVAIINTKSSAPAARRSAAEHGWTQWRRGKTLVDLCPKCWREARKTARMLSGWRSNNRSIAYELVRSSGMKSGIFPPVAP